MPTAFLVNEYLGSNFEIYLDASLKNPFYVYTLDSEDVNLRNSGVPIGSVGIKCMNNPCVIRERPNRNYEICIKKKDLRNGVKFMN